jgi:NAD(P)-dependent dehydrogenase (short-subunit alcohol dehydrogenase family)
MSAPPNHSLVGRTAVVTGATGGIGLEIARALVAMGAHVIIGARTAERGETAAAQIAPAAGGHAAVMVVDVADQASVRAFATAVRDRFPTVHILVNNAGAWFTDRRRSPEGIELTLATNLIGPHLLTALLMDPLLAAGAARVVNMVSSIQGSYEVSDLQFTRRPYDGFKAYGQSKRALCLLTLGLASQLQGTGVTVNAAAPGFVKTGFNRHAHGFRATMIGLSARLFGVSPAKGADTPVWVATAPELAEVSGRYFEARRAKDIEPGDVAELEARCQELEQVTP